MPFQWRNQNKRATWEWATDQQHQCHIECFINLRAGQPGQSKGQQGHCRQLPRCSYATVPFQLSLTVPQQKNRFFKKVIEELMAAEIIIHVHVQVMILTLSLLNQTLDNPLT